MQDRLEYIIYMLISRICCLIGLKNSRRFGKFVGSFFYYCLPIRRDVVFKNLGIAFPGITESKKRELALKNYHALGITFCEILALPSLTREQVSEEVIVENLELLEQKYSLQKGVIILTAHFGNWEFAALGVGMKLPVHASMVVKQQRNPYVSEWLNKYRSRWGNKPVLLGMSIINIFRELQDKRLVALAADQRGPEEGIRVPFFDRPSAVFVGPAALALKTGAPLLMGVAVRRENGSYCYRIDEIPTDNLPENNDEAVREITRRHTAYLEKYVRQYPDQYFWMHNRWKY